MARLHCRYANRIGIGVWSVVMLLACTVATGYGIYYWYSTSLPQDPHSDMILHEISQGPFDHIVLEHGEIESSSNIEVLCRVKSRAGGTSGTPILWVIDEGTIVNKGQLIVQLDKSQLETELQAQRIYVNSAKAKLISSEALWEQAKIARIEYLEGTYQTEEKALRSEIAIAEQELRKSQLASSSTERLVAKGLVKSLQLEADQFAVANAVNMLDAAKGRLRVLQELTKKKMLVQFDSEIQKAEAQVASDRSILQEEDNKLADLSTQIANCDIIAPQAGVVVYANRYSGRGGTAEFVVEAGAVVREQQAIVKLPDPTLMQVRAKISEGRITMVKEGMPVKITVDAVPGLELLGSVTKVNRYAEPSSFYGSSIKEYATIVQIGNPPSEIRTGMTAAVRIFADQRTDAIQVPVQGIYEHGKQTYSLIKTNHGFATREVVVAATNDTTAAISEGLKPGDVVVLDLRSHLDLLDLPELKTLDNGSVADQVAAMSPPKSKIAGSDVLGNAKAIEVKNAAPSADKRGSRSGTTAGRPSGGAAP